MWSFFTPQAALAFAWIFATGLTSSLAADTPLTPEQSAYFSSEAHIQLARPELIKLVAIAFPGCRDVNDKGSRTTFSQPMVLEDGVPKAGVWHEQHLVAGCGMNKLLNLYGIVGKDGDVKIIPTLIGTTLADIVLQRDAVMNVLLAVKSRQKDCQALAVVETRFDEKLPVPASKPKQPPMDMAWKETWTVKACEQLLDVPVQFVHGTTGTTIIPDAKTITEHH